MFRILFFSVWLLFHPVHVTLTSIDYVPEASSLKVFVRIYFDDFLSDCKLNGIDVQNKDFPGDSTVFRKALEQYLGDMVLLTVNDEPLTGKLIDTKLEDNELTMNLEYCKVNNIKTIKVKNLIMTGLYSDQSNMMIIRINNFEEGAKLTSDLREVAFKVK